MLLANGSSGTWGSGLRAPIPGMTGVGLLVGCPKTSSVHTPPPPPTAGDTAGAEVATEPVAGMLGTPGAGAGVVDGADTGVDVCVAGARGGTAGSTDGVVATDTLPTAAPGITGVAWGVVPVLCACGT